MLRSPSSPNRQALLEQRARLMRFAPTPSEQLLWREALSAGKMGVRFRRQVPLAQRFIADFFCPSLRLVVEVDGGCHQRRHAADARRERALQRLGYRLVRVEAELVLRDLPQAVEVIREAIAEAVWSGVDEHNPLAM